MARHDVFNFADASNPNLLINTNPSNVINQRGIANDDSITTGDYGPDRWYVTHDATSVTWRLVSNSGFGVNIITAGAGTEVSLAQKVEAYSVLIGEAVTFSAEVKADAACFLRISDGIGSSSSSNHTGGDTPETLYVTHTVNAGATYLACELVMTSGLADSKDMEIRKAKLELGENYTAWTVPDPAEELARCQRYGIELTTSDAYSRPGSGLVSSATTAEILCALPVNLRTTPTLTTSGSFVVRKPGIASYTVTGITMPAAAYTSNSYISIAIAVSGGGMTAPDTVFLESNNDISTSIFLDAEI
jgi:hypothetical protein